jgi:hypothetical protein
MSRASACSWVVTRPRPVGGALLKTKDVCGGGVANGVFVRFLAGISFVFGQWQRAGVAPGVLHLRPAS